MPQLEISTFPSQIFWLVLSFVILYIVLSRIVVPRISSTIKQRENEIKNNLHLSEQLFKDTEIINNLKNTTNKKINENSELLKKRLNQKLEKSENQIIFEKKKISKQIDKIALNISQEIIKKLSIDKKIKKKHLKSEIKKNIKEIN